MKRILYGLLGLMVVASFAAAAPLVVPADQPICRLYGLNQLFGTIGGVLVAAYSGFQLATNHDASERSKSKTLIGGVVVGLIIVWIAPLLVKSLVGAADVCGW